MIHKLVRLTAKQPCQCKCDCNVKSWTCAKASVMHFTESWKQEQWSLQTHEGEQKMPAQECNDEEVSDLQEQLQHILQLPDAIAMTHMSYKQLQCCACNEPWVQRNCRMQTKMNHLDKICNPRGWSPQTSMRSTRHPQWYCESPSDRKVSSHKQAWQAMKNCECNSNSVPGVMPTNSASYHGFHEGFECNMYCLLHQKAGQAITIDYMKCRSKHDEITSLPGDSDQCKTKISEFSWVWKKTGQFFKPESLL